MGGFEQDRCAGPGDLPHCVGGGFAVRKGPDIRKAAGSGFVRDEGGQGTYSDQRIDPCLRRSGAGLPVKLFCIFALLQHIPQDSGFSGHGHAGKHLQGGLHGFRAGVIGVVKNQDLPVFLTGHALAGKGSDPFPDLCGCHAEEAAHGRRKGGGIDQVSSRCGNAEFQRLFHARERQRADRIHTDLSLFLRAGDLDMNICGPVIAEFALSRIEN